MSVSHFLSYMPWLRWLVAGLPLLRCWFYPRPVHMRFVVDNMALGQLFLWVIKFSSVNIILPAFHTHLHLQVALIWRTGGQGLGTLKWSSALPEIEGIGKKSAFFFPSVTCWWSSAYSWWVFNGPRCLHVHDINFELTLNTLEWYSFAVVLAGTRFLIPYFFTIFVLHANPH